MANVSCLLLLSSTFVGLLMVSSGVDLRVPEKRNHESNAEREPYGKASNETRMKVDVVNEPISKGVQRQGYTGTDVKDRYPFWYPEDFPAYCDPKKLTTGCVGIPYEMTESFSKARYTDSEGRRVKMAIVLEEAIKIFEENTCIRFIPRDPEKDLFSYVKINYEVMKPCASSVGNIGKWYENNYKWYVDTYGVDYPRTATKKEQLMEFSMNDVILNGGCTDPAGYFHELMHAIGWPHAHIAPDRDNYITVNRSNAAGYDADRWESNFGIKSVGDLTWPPNFPWDFDSVMLYGSSSGANNDRSCDPRDWLLRRKDDIFIPDTYKKQYPSNGDFNSINLNYNCDPKRWPQLPFTSGQVNKTLYYQDKIECQRKPGEYWAL